MKKIPIIISVDTLVDYENYTVLCFDGYAVGSDGINILQWNYPQMHELTLVQLNEAMEYRFSYDWRNYVIPNYSDIFIKYGQLNNQ